MKKGASIDLVKLALYILKRCWLLILCGLIGFGVMYWNTAYRQADTYTASGTMYVVNGNPNLVNYQYASSSDLSSAVRLMDTYAVVVKSNKVMDAVVERLAPNYPTLSAGYIAGTLSMTSVAETGVMRVSCRTNDPQKSADICNTVMDVAPAEIIRVVGAGSIEVIDYASAPVRPDGRNPMRSGLTGALAGAAVAVGILTLLFLLNQRIESSRELTENYHPPVLAEVRRDKLESEDPGRFLLTSKSPMDNIESYAKLRMNLFYTLVGKENHAVMVTSAISGEGKSTIAANLAVSCAMSDRKVLLIDADMRRACQRDMFHYDDKHQKGLSDVLIGECTWQEAVMHSKQASLDLLSAGHLPPNPAEMLESPAMQTLLKELAEAYDLILLDSPPINIVSDPLALSPQVAGALFVVRQGFSDHREVRRALNTAELTGMNVLGFVFYGENLKQGGYYSRKYYRGYYHKYYHSYETRNRTSQNNEKATSERRTDGNETAEETVGAASGSASDGGTGRKYRSGKQS